jgi:hypothetical protein
MGHAHGHKVGLRGALRSVPDFPNCRLDFPGQFGNMQSAGI